jgi:hypothetical protein
LARQQRAYAARDASIEPEVVRAPDLAQLRLIAERKGIDFDRWRAHHS